MGITIWWVDASCAASRINDLGVLASGTRLRAGPGSDKISSMPSHQQIDQRSLAFGRAIAQRLRQEPELIERAQGTLNRWKQSASPGVTATFEEWKKILDGPVEQVVELLCGEDERAVRLRQSNPFVGVLDERERTAIIKQFQTK